MIYRKYGRMTEDLSLLSLGWGPESPAGWTGTDGRPPAGGGPGEATAILEAAIAQGINLVQVAHDGHKEALGRWLRGRALPFPLNVLTRLPAVGGTEAPHAEALIDPAALRAAVERERALLQRDRADIVSLSIPSSLAEDNPAALSVLRTHLRAMKKDGLLRFACAETEPGEQAYLRLIESGAFDAVVLPLNPATGDAARKVLAVAGVMGVAVLTRQPLLGGALFAMGAEVGLADRPELARTALKWSLATPGVTSVTLCTADPAHLRANVALLERPEMTEGELGLIERLKDSPAFAAHETQQRQAFFRTV